MTKPHASRRSQRKSLSKKYGLPPGALVHVGEVKTERPTITLLEYDVSGLSEKRFQSIPESRAYKPTHGTFWLNVYGLHEPEVMAEIGRRFNLHALVLEDILNTNQRPKVDDYGKYLYIVARFFDYDASTLTVRTEQVSIVLGDGFVLSFQERPTGSFDAVRERLRGDKGQIRKLGADYLAYSLLDAIVDRYFIVLEQIGERAEDLEDELLRRSTPELLRTIHQLKHETINLRRAVWPLREVVGSLQRTEGQFFKPETLPYLRDVYDHTVLVIESLEAIRDLIAGMLDIYLSNVSNRVNIELRVLTVITTTFMPATLIAGIFGMNFRTMPLLELPTGFYVVIGLMVVIAIVMATLFWRRRWFG